MLITISCFVKFGLQFSKREPGITGKFLELLIFSTFQVKKDKVQNPIVYEHDKATNVILQRSITTLDNF